MTWSALLMGKKQILAVVENGLEGGQERMWKDKFRGKSVVQKDSPEGPGREM